MIKSQLLFIILLSILFSCSSKREEYTNLQPLTFGFVLSGDNTAPSYINQLIAIDSLSALEVKLIGFNSTIERDSALYKGDIDGVMLDYIDAVILHANGFPLRIVMQNDTSYHLITSKGNGGNTIHSIQELQDGNIAIEGNNVIEYITDRILQKEGISPETGVNKSEIRKPALRLYLVQSTLINASVLPEPYASMAIEEGDHSLFSLRESDMSVTGTVFSEKAIKEKEKELEAFIKAHRNSRLPSADDIESTINWLKAKQLIPNNYQGINLIDTIKGINLKNK